jgi:hypothetical protein
MGDAVVKHEDESQSSTTSTISSGNDVEYEQDDNDDLDSNYSSADPKRKLAEVETTERGKKTKAENEDEAMEDVEMAKSGGSDENCQSEAAAEVIAAPPRSPLRPVECEEPTPAVVAVTMPEETGSLSKPVTVVPVQQQPAVSAATPPLRPASAISQQQLTGSESASGGSYLCEWNMCNRYFVSTKAVYNHVCKQHLLNSQTEDPAGCLCLWTGCDQIKRQKWSLVNHIQVSQS